MQTWALVHGGSQLLSVGSISCRDAADGVACCWLSPNTSELRQHLIKQCVGADSQAIKCAVANSQARFILTISEAGVWAGVGWGWEVQEMDS